MICKGKKLSYVQMNSILWTAIKYEILKYFKILKILTFTYWEWQKRSPQTKKKSGLVSNVRVVLNMKLK